MTVLFPIVLVEVCAINIRGNISSKELTCGLSLINFKFLRYDFIFDILLPHLKHSYSKSRYIKRVETSGEINPDSH